MDEVFGGLFENCISKRVAFLVESVALRVYRNFYKLFERFAECGKYYME